MRSFILPDEQDEEAKRKMAVMQALSRGMPQNLGQGMSAVANALMQRNATQNAAFPKAPGGATPGLGTKLTNIFTGGRNRGMY